MDPPQDRTILLLIIYPNGTTSYYRDSCSFMFISALSVVTRNWEQPRCPMMDEKILYVYIMKYYTVLKQTNKIMKFIDK